MKLESVLHSESCFVSFRCHHCRRKELLLVSSDKTSVVNKVEEETIISDLFPIPLLEIIPRCDYPGATHTSSGPTVLTHDHEIRDLEKWCERGERDVLREGCLTLRAVKRSSNWEGILRLLNNIGYFHCNTHYPSFRHVRHSFSVTQLPPCPSPFFMGKGRKNIRHNFSVELTNLVLMLLSRLMLRYLGYDIKSGWYTLGPTRT
jgi:hypothetical protein